MTEQIDAAGKGLDIEVLDHLSGSSGKSMPFLLAGRHRSNAESDAVGHDPK